MRTPSKRAREYLVDQVEQEDKGKHDDDDDNADDATE